MCVLWVPAKKYVLSQRLSCRCDGDVYLRVNVCSCDWLTRAMQDEVMVHQAVPQQADHAEFSPLLLTLLTPAMAHS